MLNARIKDWKGRRVWLIGASSGIGLALAKTLIARGARVAVSARNAQALHELAATTKPANVLALALDATQRDQLEAGFRQMTDAWGGIDLALFLQGTHEPVRAWTLDSAVAHRLVDTNLLSVIDALTVVLPRLLQQGAGGVAICSSVAGYRGLPTSLVYGATKAALINLAETLYLDLSPRGIGVWIINPGFVKTPLTDRNEFKMPALISAEEAAANIVDGLASGRFEIHFPKRFTRWLKLFRLLPYGIYFRLIRRTTGL
ncbi:MAG: SDR family NAD(P)-dependent oxidoreductase [Proteobacteria bacterium]|nr:SDR family NAD(P)-dependent oxidoreductase [Burkholderiales bacterium]